MGSGAVRLQSAPTPGQEDVLQIHLTTPLGPGTAQLSQSVVQNFLKVPCLLHLAAIRLPACPFALLTLTCRRECACP